MVRRQIDQNFTYFSFVLLAIAFVILLLTLSRYYNFYSLWKIKFFSFLFLYLLFFFPQSLLSFPPSDLKKSLMFPPFAVRTAIVLSTPVLVKLYLRQIWNQVTVFVPNIVPESSFVIIQSAF